MEDALKRNSKNHDTTINDYFNVVAGTRTEGILTSMIFTNDDIDHPLFKVMDTLKHLAQNWKNIFSPSRFLSRIKGVEPSYSTKSLEHLLKAFFLIANGKSLILIPCYDLSSTKPFLFSHVDALGDTISGYHFPVRSIIMLIGKENYRKWPINLDILSFWMNYEKAFVKERENHPPFPH